MMVVSNMDSTFWMAEPGDIQASLDVLQSDRPADIKGILAI